MTDQPQHGWYIQNERYGFHLSTGIHGVYLESGILYRDETDMRLYLTKKQLQGLGDMAHQLAEGMEDD